MPSGLTNKPAVFPALTSELLWGMPNWFVFDYLGYILIFFPEEQLRFWQFLLWLCPGCSSPSLKWLSPVPILSGHQKQKQWWTVFCFLEYRFFQTLCSSLWWTLVWKLSFPKIVSDYKTPKRLSPAEGNHNKLHISCLFAEASCPSVVSAFWPKQGWFSHVCRFWLDSLRVFWGFCIFLRGWLQTCAPSTPVCHQ